MWLLYFWILSFTTFFSPGKLLITSEYVVLDGSLALAVPTKPGQEFSAEETNDGKALIFWEAFHQNMPWLRVQIDYANWKILDTNIPSSAEFILNVLKNVQQLSQTKFKETQSYRLHTNLQFPADYGLGSSSTLMNNLAQWAEVDAFRLNRISLGGSGYDIAVAKEKSAILYRNSDEERTIEKTVFRPPFSENLILIHLNRKQDSREGISLYRSRKKTPKIIDEFTEITKAASSEIHLENFSRLMETHEQKLSEFLQMPTVKEKYFENCPVFVKSLGAWGGDFVLSAKFEGYRAYFSGKGFQNIFDWEELVAG